MRRGLGGLWSEGGQLQDRAGECVWCLLGQVVTRVWHLVVAARRGEVMCAGGAVSGGEVAVCHAVQGDDRDRDGRQGG